MSADPGSGATDVRTAVGALLTPVVGEFVCRTAVSMASKRIGKTPDTIEMTDVPALANALKPALRTLLGTPTADALVGKIRALVEPEGAPLT